MTARNSVNHGINPRVAQSLSNLQRTALIIGVIGLIATLIGGFTVGANFYQSYLYGFMFWTGLALGCLMLLFVQHLAGGSWGAMIRRPLESGAMVLPIMAIFFIPVLIGLFTNNLYIWTNAEYVADHPLVAAKTLYLNKPFFVIRSLIYFAIWIYGAYFFFKKSNQQDANAQDSAHIGFRLKGLGAPWIIIYILTMTFAGIDWAMSLTPEFFSGMYSVILMIGQVISAMCLMIFTTTYLASKDEQYDDVLTTKRLQDLGNFLMAFTMFWAYTSIAQFIIIWSNNVIETNPYYVLRTSEAWRVVGGFLLFFGFFAPFVILFSRWVKRKRQALVMVAMWAVLIRLTDLFFIIIPNFRREGFQLHWLDFAVLIGIGGIWVAVFVSWLKSRPILPQHDPRLAPADHH
jgi:hypothetical protein